MVSFGLVVFYILLFLFYELLAEREWVPRQAQVLFFVFGIVVGDFLIGLYICVAVEALLHLD